MGKIRVKTLGDEEAEKKQKEKVRVEREEKTARLASKGKILDSDKAKQIEKKGESKLSVSATVIKTSEDKEKGKTVTTETQKSKLSGSVVAKKSKISARKRSARYNQAKTKVEKRPYKLEEALDLLEKLKRAKFDETVELHVNTIEPVSGSLNLPYGTGKKTRVAVADDKILADVEKGKIEFDILVATPQMMPKLAKVARILGPRGLMPNPKNGTITPKPEDVVKKYEGGQINFKTESKAPVLHLSIGKLSFGKEKISDNLKTVFTAIPKGKVKNAVLKSTMSPAIKLDFA